MEPILSPNICRICLKTNSKLLSLYQKDDDEDDSPRVMLSKLTGIHLEDEHLLLELPKKICKNCICELNLSFQFFEKALQAQSHIEQFLAFKENTDLKDTEIKFSERAEELETNEEALEQHRENSTIEEIDEIYEYHEILETKMNILPSDDINAQTDAHIERKMHSKTKYIKNKKKTKQKYDKDHPIMEDDGKVLPAPDEKPFEKLSKRGRKPKAEGLQSNAQINSHVCEICGNVFTKRGRLTEHLRRHETEAKYACELCDERFFFREALRRHMFKHLGGKPFKCDFCSRTFFYESVKKAHEAIHAGYKPYVCDKCDKAFAYPHALKKHKLIHDDIKLFSCKYCQKDFRLQHHMKQHEETKAHINAVLQQKNL